MQSNFQYKLSTLCWITGGCAVATNSCVHYGHISVLPMVAAIVGMDIFLIVRTNNTAIWGMLVGTILGAALFLKTTAPIPRDNVFSAQLETYAALSPAVVALLTRC